MKTPRILENLLEKIKNVVSDTETSSELGLLLFSNTSEVIRAESLLKNAGLEVTVKGPPPAVRTGCDLAIQFPLKNALRVAHILSESGIEPLKIIPVQDVLLEPVSLFHTRDYGEFLMVRAANMKITVSKADQRIVNVSGGGCPDVPYLADQLVGKTLHDCPPPISLGRTLCGYALHLAYQELIHQCRG
jgi:hypothetical protein